jgi:hypothetical protein
VPNSSTETADLAPHRQSDHRGVMTITGTLISESLRVGASVEGIALTMTKVARAKLADLDAGQPLVWTFIDFEIADEDGDQLAHLLEGSLEREGGWYCDFRNERETFVVFAHRTFRYPRGDEVGRATATEYGRSVGVPETQLDWPI